MRKLHTLPAAAALLAAIGCTQASGMPRTPAMTLETSGARMFHGTMAIAECWAGGGATDRQGRIRAVAATGDRVEFRITRIHKGTYRRVMDWLPAVAPLSVTVGGARYTATGDPTLTLYDAAAKSGSVTHTHFVDAANRPVTLNVEATWRCE
jgi:uncharacterized protein (DUF2141 family)